MTINIWVSSQMLSKGNKFFENHQRLICRWVMFFIDWWVVSPKLWWPIGQRVKTDVVCFLHTIQQIINKYSSFAVCLFRKTITVPTYSKIYLVQNIRHPFFLSVARSSTSQSYRRRDVIFAIIFNRNLFICIY